MKLLICRTIIIYLCVLFAMRLMGKRQLGELQPEELVSTILISNLASISIESEEVPITSSLIPLFLIAALELLGSVLSFRSQKFFNFLSGRPKTVILDGQIDQNALRMLRLTTADLMEALRGKNIFDPREVSYAVIETNGTLSAALRPEKEPARLADLQLKVTHTNATIPFVLDGQVLEDNLRWCGKDRAWLERTAQANTLLPEEILLLIGNETEGLRPGMNANAEIVVAEAKNTLTVPNAAIVRGSYVLVTKDSPSAANADPEMEAPDGYVYVDVKTGVSDDDYTEILDGITAEDTIAYDPNSVSDSYYDDGSGFYDDGSSSF